MAGRTLIRIVDNELRTYLGPTVMCCSMCYGPEPIRMVQPDGRTSVGGHFLCARCWIARRALWNILRRWSRVVPYGEDTGPLYHAIIRVAIARVCAAMRFAAAQLHPISVRAAIGSMFETTAESALTELLAV